MASFKIEWKRTAAKELVAIDKVYISAIIKQVESLSINPTPAGTKKLTGTQKTYRLRVGNYRVIYEIDKKENVIIIIRLRHRKDVYN